MKRMLSLTLILCLLAALLSGCGTNALPSVPPPPGSESAPDDGAPSDTAAPDTPAALELSFSLPTADPRGEELAYYFSPAEELDCGFACPSFCTVWVEDGAIRLNPGWFFARMFFTSVRRDAPDAPDALSDLLETDKWGTLPEEGTAGAGHAALRARHLKYDTWREWIAWETPERFYLLYGACFDGREENLASVFETVAESFRTGGELLTAAPESGTLLRQSGALSLYFDGAALVGGSSPRVELRLRAVNRGESMQSFAIPVYTADGRDFPLEETLGVLGGEEQPWTLTLPLLDGGSGLPCGSLGFTISARGADGGSLFELPVRIELNR